MLQRVRLHRGPSPSGARVLHGLCAALLAALAAGCSTAPKPEDYFAFLGESHAAVAWFETHVTGLREQIDGSAGYIIYPAVGEWGLLIGGGKDGRGMLNRPDDSQIGWATVNTASFGPQLGARGFMMLVVLENDEALRKFKSNRLSGGVSGVFVVGQSGVGEKAPFENGVVIYQGANSGLMTGINVGLDSLRYAPLEPYERF